MYLDIGPLNHFTTETIVKYAILALSKISSPTSTRTPETRSHVGNVITPARCGALGSSTRSVRGTTPHQPAGSENTSRRAQSSCGGLTRPSLRRAGRCVREGQGLQPPGGRRRRRFDPPRPPPAALLPLVPGAGPSRRRRRLHPRRARSRDPRGGAPSAIFPSARARARQRGARAAAPATLPLEPHLSLSFLTCSRLSPVLSLTPK